MKILHSVVHSQRATSCRTLRPHPAPLKDQGKAPGRRPPPGTPRGQPGRPAGRKAGKRALHPANHPGRDEPAPRGDHHQHRHARTRTRRWAPRSPCIRATSGGQHGISGVTSGQPGHASKIAQKGPDLHECGSGRVARGGVEPPTFRFSGGRSYRLSYLPTATHGWVKRS